MEANIVYLVLAILGVGALVISLITAMLEIDFMEVDNPYIYKLITSFIAGIGLGGLKWGITGAVITGIAFASLMALVIWIFISLRKENGISLEESIGKIGTITILDKNAKSGKALFEIGSSLREIDFLSKEKLKLGVSIEIEKIENETIYVKSTEK